MSDLHPGLERQAGRGGDRPVRDVDRAGGHRAREGHGRAHPARDRVRHRPLARRRERVLRRVRVVAGLVEVEDLAVARVPDAGLVLLRAGDAGVPVVHVDRGVGAVGGVEDGPGDPHPGHDRARRPVVALDLVVEAAGGRPPAGWGVLALEEDVVTLTARDEAAVRRRPEGVVLDGDEDREVGQGEPVAIGDPGVVDRHDGSLGEGRRRRRLWRQQGEEAHHPSHGRAPQAPPRVRHATTPFDAAGAAMALPAPWRRPRPGGLRPDHAPVCTPRAKGPRRREGPPDLAQNLMKYGSSGLSDNNPALRRRSPALSPPPDPRPAFGQS